MLSAQRAAITVSASGGVGWRAETSIPETPAWNLSVLPDLTCTSVVLRPQNSSTLCSEHPDIESHFSTSRDTIPTAPGNMYSLQVKLYL